MTDDLVLIEWLQDLVPDCTVFIVFFGHGLTARRHIQEMSLPRLTYCSRWLWKHPLMLPVAVLRDCLRVEHCEQCVHMHRIQIYP